MKQTAKTYLKEPGVTVSELALTFLLTGALLICVLSGGCARKVYIPAESVTTRTDTVYNAKLRVDSVIFRDSVAVMQRGDTVLITKYRDRFRYRERIDTVYQAMTDSIKVSVPYPVERKLTRWEQAKQDMGVLFLGGLVAAVVSVVIVWIVKLKRRKP